MHDARIATIATMQRRRVQEMHASCITYEGLLYCILNIALYIHCCMGLCHARLLGHPLCPCMHGAWPCSHHHYLHHAMMEHQRAHAKNPTAHYDSTILAVWKETSFDEGGQFSTGPTWQPPCMTFLIIQRQRDFKEITAAPFGVPNGWVYVKNGAVKVSA